MERDRLQAIPAARDIDDIDDIEDSKAVRVSEMLQHVDSVGIVEVQHPSDGGTGSRIAWSSLIRIKPRHPAQPGPAAPSAAAVDVFHLQPCLGQQLGQRDVAKPEQFGGQVRTP